LYLARLIYDPSFTPVQSKSNGRTHFATNRLNCSCENCKFLTVKRTYG